MVKKALISIRCHSSGGLDELKKIIIELTKIGDLGQLSSVYKVDRERVDSKHIHDLRSRELFLGLSVVVQVLSQFSPSEILGHLKSIEEKYDLGQQGTIVKFKLLLVDNIKKMTPSLTLPYPELHLHPEDIVPLSEISGDENHPVLEKSFRELAQKYNSIKWGEFYAQGKTII